MRDPARPLRFPKDHRLRRRADFVRVQGSSKRTSTPHFLFLLDVSLAGATAPPRIGFVVSKKIGTAVVRNRVKRVAREVFRLSPGFFPDGIDVVVIARGGADALSLAQVQAEWARARAHMQRKAEEIRRGANDAELHAEKPRSKA